MISQRRTAWIVRYDNKEGFAGKLLGVITFTDAKSLKVWDGKLHEQCQQLAEQSRSKPFDVHYTFKPSAKWGDALASIEDGRPDYEQYDAARATSEAHGRSHKQGGFIADRISKRVQHTVDQEQPQPGTYERVMGRE